MSQSFSHLQAASKSSWRFCASLIVLISLYMILSSAKSLRVLCCKYSGKSFIYTRKRIGPEQCPGGLLM